MRHWIIVLGMPGAGKDTQCDLLARELSAEIMKTGDIARELAKTNKQIEQTLRKGGLIDDELINKHLAEKLDQTASQPVVIFDGFPRRREQAEWLDQYIAQKSDIDLHVYYLEISSEVAFGRLLGRGRADDQADIIRNRLGVFTRETEPVLDYYRQSGLLKDIDGERTPSEIYDELAQDIRRYT